jgi:hypothetical protein
MADARDRPVPVYTVVEQVRLTPTEVATCSADAPGARSFSRSPSRGDVASRRGWPYAYRFKGGNFEGGNAMSAPMQPSAALGT